MTLLSSKNQKVHRGRKVLSASVTPEFHTAVHGIAAAEGYDSISLFVQDALKERCQKFLESTKPNFN